MGLWIRRHLKKGHRSCVILLWLLLLLLLLPWFKPSRAEHKDPPRKTIP